MAIGIFAYVLFLISLPIWSFGIGIAIFHLIILGPILAVFAMLTVTPPWFLIAKLCKFFAGVGKSSKYGKFESASSDYSLSQAKQAQQAIHAHVKALQAAQDTIRAVGAALKESSLRSQKRSALRHSNEELESAFSFLILETINDEDRLETLKAGFSAFRGDFIDDETYERIRIHDLLLEATANGDEAAAEALSAYTVKFDVSAIEAEQIQKNQDAFEDFEKMIAGAKALMKLSGGTPVNASVKNTKGVER